MLVFAFCEINPFVLVNALYVELAEQYLFFKKTNQNNW